MAEPWELFFAEWERKASHAHLLGRGAGEANIAQMSDAVSHASRETIKHLRNRCEWSLVNTHLLVAQLVEVATDWVLSGSDDTGVLRSRLQRVWKHHTATRAAEEGWRKLTEALLVGRLNDGAPGWQRTPAVH